ncbi:MAG: alpha/beta hydrolase [Spirochaetia bacterium]|nr:alpha/beta hydrolase [Spirochaetia bacterium]
MKNINGFNMNYVDKGEGTPVVLIHGFPLRKEMWQGQIDFLAKEGYRVIAPDLRGFGKSEYKSIKSISDFSDDIAALLDELKIEKTVIGGMSMGGYILLDFLDRHSEKAKAAVFIVTRAGADNDAGKVKRTELSDKTLGGEHDIAAKTFSPILFAESSYEKNSAMVDMVYDWAATTNPQAISDSLIAMRDRKDYVSKLPDFNLPALVIGGAEDRTIPVENSKQIADNLPYAKLEIIADAGHMANLENPSAFNKALIDFLNSL